MTKYQTKCHKLNDEIVMFPLELWIFGENLCFTVDKSGVKKKKTVYFHWFNNAKINLKLTK